MWMEEDFVVSHKKAFKKRKQKKGLKEGKDTEEKRWFILHCMLTFFHSLHRIYALFESELVVLG